MEYNRSVATLVLVKEYSIIRMLVVSNISIRVVVRGVAMENVMYRRIHAFNQMNVYLGTLVVSNTRKYSLKIFV